MEVAQLIALPDDLASQGQSCETKVSQPEFFAYSILDETL